MQCPACSNSLSEVKVGEVTVDVCKDGCAGIWFDNFELKKMDEPHEAIGEELLDLQMKPGLKVDRSAKKTCPRCKDIKMLQHNFTTKREIEIDLCGGCGGYWLDAGELRLIRSQFKTEADREKAAHEFFSESFDSQLEAQRAASQADLAKAQSFAKMFRFICPTNYIPGKQDWGAF